mgnify:CR=1 FL=1
MKISIVTVWIVSITCFFFIWPLGLVGICISLYLTVQNQKDSGKQQDEKEKELLRKQNEILLHLIQDEHREEGR